MKLQPESKKELLRIACGVSLCTAVMWVVFAALHLVGWGRCSFWHGCFYAGRMCGHKARQHAGRFQKMTL